MGHRQVRELVQGHTAERGSGAGDSNAGLLAQEAMLLRKSGAPGHIAKAGSLGSGAEAPKPMHSTEHRTVALSRGILGDKRHLRTSGDESVLKASN